MCNSTTAHASSTIQYPGPCTRTSSTLHRKENTSTRKYSGGTSVAVCEEDHALELRPSDCRVIQCRDNGRPCPTDKTVTLISSLIAMALRTRNVGIPGGLDFAIHRHEVRRDFRKRNMGAVVECMRPLKCLSFLGFG